MVLVDMIPIVSDAKNVAMYKWRNINLNLDVDFHDMVITKYTNRKIRKTEFIYICGSKNVSSSSAGNTGEV